MAKLYREGIRRDLRQRLVSHIEGTRENPGPSPRDIAADIERHVEVYGRAVSASTIYRFVNPKNPVMVSDKCLEVLETYLERASRGEAMAPARETGRLFAELQAFFEMRLPPDTVIELQRAVAGMYAFYAYSESGRERVCQGAIEFSVAQNGDFEVREVQRGVPSVARIAHNEVFTGHFIFGHNSLIAMLRDDQEKQPKFYILSIPPYRNNDKQNVVMDGALLKIGVQQTVFIGNVLLVRRETALEECTVMERSEVEPSDILDYLDSDRWAARQIEERNSSRLLRRRRLARVLGNLNVKRGVEPLSLNGARATDTSN